MAVISRLGNKKRVKDKSEGKIAHKKTIIDGISFHSKMESKYYEMLKEQKESGVVAEFTLQPSFVLQDKFVIFNGEAIFDSNPDFSKIKRKNNLPTISAIKYISDFDVTYADGTRKIIDTKGLDTADFNIKRKMFMAKYPKLTLDVTILNKGEWVDYYEHKKEKARKKKSKKLAEK